MEDIQIYQAFSEDNAQIYQLFDTDIHNYAVQKILNVIESKVVKAKLSLILDFYKPPAQTFDFSQFRLNSSPLNNTLQSFVTSLSKKLNLHQASTFQLLETYIQEHPGQSTKLQQSEHQLLNQALIDLENPLIKYYYRERTFLLKACLKLVINATNQQSSIQDYCIQFVQDNNILEKVNQQLENSFNKQIPDEIQFAQAIEEWIQQTLIEQKELIQILIILYYDTHQCTPEKLLTYLSTFYQQNFMGSWRQLQQESKIAEYRHASEEIAEQISSLSMILILACIRLDSFCERGTLPRVDKDKNPFNFLCVQQKYNSLKTFFKRLYESEEVLPEQLGPINLQWMCALCWGSYYPDNITCVDQEDIEIAQQLSTGIASVDYLWQVTQKEPFKSSNSEIADAMKYLIKQLIGNLHSQCDIQSSPSYGVFVDVACQCLKGFALSAFWNQDFQVKDGLYLMLDYLQARFPFESHSWIQVIKVLIGDKNNNFAPEVVSYLNNLTSYTVPTQKSQIALIDHENQRVKSISQLTHRIITIPVNSVAEILQDYGPEHVIAKWHINYSLWPIIFTSWTESLQSLKRGAMPDFDALMQYIDLYTTLIIQDPEICNRIDDIINEVEDQFGQEVILAESFIELSRLDHSPSWLLSKILDALTELYKSSQPFRVAQALINVSRGQKTIFSLANGIRGKEIQQNNISLACLRLLLAMIKDQNFMLAFNANPADFIQDGLKFVFSEIFLDSSNWQFSQRQHAILLINKILYYTLKKLPLVQSAKTILIYNIMVEIVNRANLVKFLRDQVDICPKADESNELKFINRQWNNLILKEGSIDDQNLLYRSIYYAIECINYLIQINLYQLDEVFNPILDQLLILNELKRAIQNNYNDEASQHLVICLMANIKPPEFGLEKHSHCVASMKALCSLMAYWKMTSNAPSLHYFLVGEKTSIKNEFFKIVFAYLFDKGINMSDQMKSKFNSYALQYFTLALTTQKPLMNEMFNEKIPGCSFEDLIGKLFQFSERHYDGDYYTIQNTVHFLIFIDEIIRQQQHYKQIAELFLKDDRLISNVFKVAVFILRVTDEMDLQENLVLFHGYKALFDILASHVLNSSSSSQIIQLVFQRDTFHKLLKKLTLISISPHTANKMNQVQTYLNECQLFSNDFEGSQIQPNLHWSLLDTDLNSYGIQYHYQYKLVSDYLISQEGDPNFIELISQAFADFNQEQSLIDAQNKALLSFKQLVGVLASFGQSGKKMSSAKRSSATQGISKGFFCVPETEKVVGNIFFTIWSDTIKDTIWQQENIKKSFEYKLQIMMYCLNLGIHMQSKEQLFERTITRFLAEINDIIPFIEISTEFLTFLLVVVQYMQIISMQSDSIFEIIDKLGQRIDQIEDCFALCITVFEGFLQLMKEDDQVLFFTQSRVIRKIYQYIQDTQCSDQALLAVLKFSVNLAQSHQGAKLLLSDRVLVAFNNNQRIKGMWQEYEGQSRSSSHILWCWTLILADQLLDTLVDQPGLQPLVIGFLQANNDRVVYLLSYNLEDGLVQENKKFSIAYLEELQLLISILKKLSQIGPKQQVIEYLRVAASNIFRITVKSVQNVFQSNSKFEKQMDQIDINSSSKEEKKLDILGGRKKQEILQENQLNSIQTLHTEITVIEIFENLLEGLISIQQYEKIYPDPKLFIELLEFATQFYNNYTFNHSLSQASNVCKTHYNSVESFQEFASLNNIFNFEANSIIESTTNVVEMTFYALIQQNASEHRKTVQDKFKRWINLANQQSHFIKWVQDNFNEDDNIGLGW